MVRRASPRLLAYLTFASAAMLIGLATARIDLVVYASPFVLFVLVGLAASAEPVVRIDVDVEPQRSLESEPIDVIARLESPTGVPRIDVAIATPSGVRAAGESSTVHVLRLDSNDQRTLTVPVVADRWGAFALGDVVVRAHDHLSLFTYELETAPVATVRFYPQAEQVRGLVRPHRTQMVAGDRVARRSMGEGIELADLRLFQAGDRPRDVNWRVSARRGDLWVTQRHPERSTDVVVFVDMFSEAMLLPAVRSAATLVDAYLRTRDRVGLVGFGGVLQWVRGGQGVRQIYRLLDTLVDARTFFSYAWKDVSVIPPHVLRPGSLVIGISPLEDERSRSALIDLRARGYEVAVIELMPPDDAGGADPSEVDALALRLWKLQREHQRNLLRQLGIAVSDWHIDEPFGPSMEVLWHASEAGGAQRLG